MAIGERLSTVLFVSLFAAGSCIDGRWMPLGGEQDWPSRRLHTRHCYACRPTIATIVNVVITLTLRSRSVVYTLFT